MRGSSGSGTAVGDWSYGRALRERRLALLLAGGLLTNVSDGMLITALPVQTLRIHGSLDAATSIAVVEAAPFPLAILLAVAVGGNRLRLSLRALLCLDCVLRAATFAMLGNLALRGALTMPVLMVGLLLGSMFRLVALGGFRLLATSMVPEEGRFAVNGLIGVGVSVAAFVVGPAAGGVIATSAGAGAVFLIHALCLAALLAVVLVAVPGRRGGEADGTGADAGSSGWAVLRRVPVAARLFAVVFFFNLFYMPVEVALPLLVRGPLDSGAVGLGAIWSGFGVGALAGAVATNYLRRFPQHSLLVGIIAGWGASVLVLAVAPTVTGAVLAFTLGGFIYAPFTPVAYTYVQSLLSDEEQRPVITLWTTGATVASPVGLLASGPLVSALGARGALTVSALITVALVPIATWGLHARRRAVHVTASRSSHAPE